jgi:hypothetical protein
MGRIVGPEVRLGVQPELRQIVRSGKNLELNFGVQLAKKAQLRCPIELLVDLLIELQLTLR